MNSKRLWIIFAAAGALLVLVVSLFIFISSRPSEEMTSLRSLEKELNLPPSDDRYEIDEGENKDYKGVRHYERLISNSYEDHSTVSQFADSLQEKGWENIGGYEDESATRLNFYSSEHRACLLIMYDPEPKRGRRNYINLEPEKAEGCQLALEGQSKD